MELKRNQIHRKKVEKRLPETEGKENKERLVNGMNFHLQDE